MNAPPTQSNPRDSKADSDLKQLAGYHFLFVAALLGFVLMFFATHFADAINSNDPNFWKIIPRATRDSSQSMHDILFFYGDPLMILLAFLNLLSGFCLWRRKDRRVSLIVAGLNCLQIPFGTMLGISTFKALKRPAVKDLYQNNFDAPPMKAAYQQFKAEGARLGIW